MCNCIKPKAVHWRRTVVELREGNWKITHSPTLGCGSRGWPVRTWRTKLESSNFWLLNRFETNSDLRAEILQRKCPLCANSLADRWTCWIDANSCEKCKQSPPSHRDCCFFWCQLNTYAHLLRFVFLFFRFRLRWTFETVSTTLGALTGWARRDRSSSWYNTY